MLGEDGSSRHGTVGWPGAPCQRIWVVSLSPVGCTISVKEYSLNLKFFQVLNQDSKEKKDESIVTFKNIFCCGRKLIMLEAFEPISRSNKT